MDLAEYFITSKAEKINSNIETIKVKADDKCDRCWKIFRVLGKIVQLNEDDKFKTEELIKKNFYYFIFVFTICDR